MIEEINYSKRYDELLDVQPSYGIDRIKKPVDFNSIGLEIEISVNYERERYTFIRTLLKKIKQAVGDNGYFTSDGTIIGNYSFEIVLDPLPVKKIKKIYSTLLRIMNFSDGSILMDKGHNCGIHMNFNQYDMTNPDPSHQRLLLLMKEEPKYFEENVYKQVVYDFDFKEYLEFQRNVSAKYTAINYLNKKLIEVRNIKVGLTAGELEKVMNLLLDAIYFDKREIKVEKKATKDLTKIMSRIWQKNNSKTIKKALDDEMMIVLFTNKGPKIVFPNGRIRNKIKELGEE